MIAMASDTAFVLCWWAFTAAAFLWAAAVIIWAARNKQFANQKRARYLALWSGIPEEDEAGGDGSKEDADKVKDDVQPR